ncbi:SDR family NAD(P)-dependent oxidoreductase [Arenibaculum pallidiluteum]|uniref:SDR family NAD(P)-dependent oxidoreductase n=1 Tax=Arenibaculum pallidiluteum TaxID=2812559 RepID=UPI001A9592BE|nr:SDR family NAD(P)-dependent oxidoreductase [Arenibaculum pallidiluteum]
MRDPRSIVITGGSSGLGAALAEAYAAPGIALALTGRDAARLEAVAGRCRAAGAEVRTAVLDVTDRDRLSDWLASVDAAAPVDLVIANAGISGGSGDGGETGEQARAILATNVMGVVDTVMPLLPAMRARRRGQVAVMASLAGFAGLPSAPAYCASKAAVRVWGEALHGAVAHDGVEVSVICPGFVRTPLTAVNPFPMPLLMDAGKAAAVIVAGLARGRARIAFPWPTYLAVRLLSALPPGLVGWLLRRAPAKPELGRADVGGP